MSQEEAEPFLSPLKNGEIVKAITIAQITCKQKKTKVMKKNKKLKKVYYLGWNWDVYYKNYGDYFINAIKGLKIISGKIVLDNLYIKDSKSYHEVPKIELIMKNRASSSQIRYVLNVLKHVYYNIYDDFNFISGTVYMSNDIVITFDRTNGIIKKKVKK